MNDKYKKIYNEFGLMTLECIINNNIVDIDINLEKEINKIKYINYSKKKIIDIKNYTKNPNISEYEYIIKKYKCKLTDLSIKEQEKLRFSIKKHIKYYDIDTKKNCNVDLYSVLNNNLMFNKYKDKIVFHLNSKIKGYRTIYLPLENKCHVIGNYRGRIKDLIFIFHELGHCFQLLSTEKILFNYTNAEIFACANEVLMSKENNILDMTIKMINNKILESICTFDFYQYIYKIKIFDVNDLNHKWKTLCQYYGIPFIENKWLTDINSIERPENIISYCISYLISLKFTNGDYDLFKKLCFSEIEIKDIV